MQVLDKIKHTKEKIKEILETGVMTDTRFTFDDQRATFYVGKDVYTVRAVMYISYYSGADPRSPSKPFYKFSAYRIVNGISVRQNEDVLQALMMLAWPHWSMDDDVG